jgi:hypothetical protein
LALTSAEAPEDVPRVAILGSGRLSGGRNTAPGKSLGTLPSGGFFFAKPGAIKPEVGFRRGLEPGVLF